MEAMEYGSDLHPMEFGELFGKGLDFVRRTMPTAGLISIGYAIVMCLITWWFLGDIGRMMLEAMQQAEVGARSAPHFPTSLLIVYPFQIVSGLVAYFIAAVTLIASWEVANDRDVTLGQVSRSALARPMWYMFLQNLALGFALGFAIMIVMFVTILFAVVTKGVALVVLVPLIALGGLAVAVALAFAPYEIVANGRGPLKSMKMSYELVRSNWGRVTGVLLVLVLISVVIFGVVAIPAIGPITAFVREIIANVPSEGEASRDAVMQIMRDFFNTFPFWLIPVYTLLGSVLTLYQRNVLMATYIDLRARRGDFNTYEDEGLGMGE
ncbi:MAG: hypothetical protein JST22_07470 [Bacteroidetes bacterium]|nr:hypothetical protein [Bacteroidota bacterium]